MEGAWMLLYGDIMLTSFHADDVYNTGQTIAVIILLVGTLMKNYRGRDTISCGDAAKYYINPDIPEKESYSQSLGQHLPIVRWMKTEDDHYHTAFERSKPDTVEVNYLVSTDPNDFLAKNMVCTVTITRLYSTTWWFLACSKCHKTAYPTGNEFSCSDQSCSCARAEPRYKVRVIGADKTGETEFVFFAGVAEQIIGKKVDILIRAAGRKPDSIPAEISAFVSQKFTLNISLNEKGLQYGKLSFQVNSVDVVHPKTKIFEFNALASGSQSGLAVSMDTGSVTTDSPNSQPTRIEKYAARTRANPAEHSSDELSITPPRMTKPPIMPSADEAHDAIGSSLANALLGTPPSVTKDFIVHAIDAGSVSEKQNRKRPASDSKKPLAPKKLFKEG